MNATPPIMPPATTGRSPPVVSHDYWKRDSSSVSAVSFGFVATAVVISVFLVVAIFERFLRRPSTPPVSSIHDEDTNATEAPVRQFSRKRELGGHDLETRDVIRVSVLMPGQKVPTFIANPVPISCSHEGISWPTHEHGNVGSCSFDPSSNSQVKSDHEENGTGLV